MILTAFYERRKVAIPIDSNDHRMAQRRNHPKPFSPEQRRLASQIRRYERETFKIPVRLQMPGGEISGYTHDISSGGLLIFGEGVLTIGTPVSLQFSFGENVCYLNISGQVVFCLLAGNGVPAKHAIGIKFSGIRDFEQKILTSAVKELKQNIVGKSSLSIFVSKDTLAIEVADISIKYGDKGTDASIKTPENMEGDDRSHVGLLRALTRKKKFTPHPNWILDLDRSVEPYRKAILECRLVQGASTGTLSLKQMRAWITQLYPFIETFPKYIALNITKAQDPFSRGILIDNVRVEKKHAEMWVVMAERFGIDPYELYTVQPIPEVDALTHWLWSINTQGTLPEAVGANTYAIEGVTQGIATLTIKGFPHYDGLDRVCLDKKAYWWMEAHARYDEQHPIEALEIIKLYTTTKDLQEKVKFATRRSLEFFLMALEACYTHFQP